MTTPPRSAGRRPRPRLVSRVSRRMTRRRTTTTSTSAISRCPIPNRTRRWKSVAARRVAVSNLPSTPGRPVSLATPTMRWMPRLTPRSARRRNPWTPTSSTTARWPRLTDTSPGTSCTESRTSRKNPRMRMTKRRRATTGFRCGSTTDRTSTATTRFSGRWLRLSRTMRRRLWMMMRWMRATTRTKTPSLNPKSQSQRLGRSRTSPSPS
mmetsp:Transcript_9808/g.44730  ORF Transcript_9808/g.44730 Transcript_9808/m.44730 type:complete len:209 (+) Transcript_9808:2265-2891(+)